MLNPIVGQISDSFFAKYQGPNFFNALRYGWPNVAKFKNKNIDHIQGYKSHSTNDFTFNTFNHNHIQGPFSQPRNKITFNKIFHTQETKIVFNNHIQRFFFLSTTFFLSTISFSVNNFFFCQQFFLSTTFFYVNNIFYVNNFFLLSTNPMMLLGKLMYPLAIVMKAVTFSRQKF